MFDANLKIIGINEDHASALWKLITLQKSRRKRSPLLIALTRDTHPILLTDGTKQYSYSPDSVKTLNELAGKLSSLLSFDIVVAIEQEMLRNIVEELQKNSRSEWDIFDYAGNIFYQIKRGLDNGKIAIHPEFLRPVFNLDTSGMRKFLDFVFPKNSSMIFYFFRKQKIETAIIMVRHDKLIDTIAGHDLISQVVSDFYPWQKGYRKLIEAIETNLAPPSLGFFASIQELEKFISQPQPGSFIKAMIDGKIIIDPMPAWAAAAVGIDAIAKVTKTSSEIVRKLNTSGIIGKFNITEIGKKIHQTFLTAEVSIESILGFDPFVIINKIISIFVSR